MSTIKTQCRCGAIEVEVSAPPIAQLYCHCDDCQAAHSAAYVSASIYPAQAVAVVKGQPVSRAVKSTPRMFCPECGTHVFIEIESLGLRSLNAYLLPKGEFKPQFHLQCQHAVLPVVDDLPHFKAFPAAFGGSDETVDW